MRRVDRKPSGDAPGSFRHAHALELGHQVEGVAALLAGAEAVPLAAVTIELELLTAVALVERTGPIDVRFGPMKSRDQGAFSMLELVFVVIIFGVVLYAIYALFSAGRRMDDTLSAHLGMQAEARRALMEFMREL